MQYMWASGHCLQVHLSFPMSNTVQLNLTILNSVNSKSLLLQSLGESPLFDRDLVLTRLFRNPCYFEQFFLCRWTLK